MDTLNTSFALLGLFVCGLVWLSERRVRTALIHVVIALLYIAPAAYTSTIHRVGDVGIGWMVVRIMGTVTHCCVAGILLVIALVKRRNASVRRSMNTADRETPA